MMVLRFLVRMIMFFLKKNHVFFNGLIICSNCEILMVLQFFMKNGLLSRKFISLYFFCLSLLPIYDGFSIFNVEMMFVPRTILFVGDAIVDYFQHAILLCDSRENQSKFWINNRDNLIGIKQCVRIRNRYKLFTNYYILKFVIIIIVTMQYRP